MARQRSVQFNSRQYMLSKDYEIYYYSDLHFQSVGSHRHDYYEFYFFVEGAVTMELGGKRCPLAVGDVVIVPPGVPHRAVLTDSAVPYRRFVLWLSREYAEALATQAKDSVFCLRRAETGRYHWHFDVLSFNSLRASLFDLLDELHAERFGKEAQVDLNLRQLLLRLSRLIHEQTDKRSHTESVSKYEAITAFIDAHLEEDLSLDRLAREFFLSKYYIAHLFQDSVGLSVHQSLIKKRLAACCGAIQSGAKLSELYLSYGFRDYSSFYRAFRKEYGMSPSEYRDTAPHAELAGSS